MIETPKGNKERKKSVYRFHYDAVRELKTTRHADRTDQQLLEDRQLQVQNQHFAAAAFLYSIL